jgi:hypothetical protein
MDHGTRGGPDGKVTPNRKHTREDPKMPTTKILKSLLVAMLLSCTSAYAGGDTSDSFKVSDLRCKFVEGQVRCTFSG